MNDLTIWTYDWVPEMPRGFVRDMRLRWACEEAGLAYSVRTVAFEGRETNHLDQQPFGQVPVYEEDGLTLFETGSILTHIGERSEVLLPKDPAKRDQAAAIMNDIQAIVSNIHLVADDICGTTSDLLEPFRFSRFAQGKLHPTSNSPFPWS